MKSRVIALPMVLITPSVSLSRYYWRVGGNSTPQGTGTRKRHRDTLLQCNVEVETIKDPVGRHVLLTIATAFITGPNRSHRRRLGSSATALG